MAPEPDSKLPSASYDGSSGDYTSKYPVYLKVYDQSNGLVQHISKPILGYQLDGAWHVGVAVYGKEYFYGDGICSLAEKECEEITAATLVKCVYLGDTEHSQQEFEDYLERIDGIFTEADYNFFDWNCINFSNTAALYLVGNIIPEEYIMLVERLRQTCMGRLSISCIKVGRGCSMLFKSVWSRITGAICFTPRLQSQH